MTPTKEVNMTTNLKPTFRRNCARGSGERTPLIRIAKFLLVAGLSVGIGFTAPAEANAPLKQLVERTPEAAQAYAQKVIKYESWGATQWKCLKSLWTAESNWRPDAFNKTPGLPSAQRQTSSAARWRYPAEIKP
jgi:hypothetical protein